MMQTMQTDFRLPFIHIILALERRAIGGNADDHVVRVRVNIIVTASVTPSAGYPFSP